MLFVGIVTVATGMVGATWIQLGLTPDPRRSRRARALLLVGMIYITVPSVVTLNRASDAESAAHAGRCWPCPRRCGPTTRPTHT